MFDILSDFFGFILGFLYEHTESYGLSVILLTIFYRTITLPLVALSMKSQRKMAILQPRIQELQKKYSDDKAVLHQKMIELYQEHGHNPLSGCLPALIQLPIVIALFGIFKDPKAAGIPESAIGQSFFWLPNLEDPDFLSNIIPIDIFEGVPGLLPVIAAVATWFQMGISSTSNNTSNSEMSGSMSFFRILIPLIILWSGSTFSAGLALYWAVGTLFQLVQYKILIKKFNEADGIVSKKEGQKNITKKETKEKKTSKKNNK